MSIDWNIVTTILAALFWFLIGYWGRQPEEEFEPTKVFKTIVAGLIVGVMIVVFKVPEPQAITALDVLSRMGAIVALEKLYKILLKWFDQDPPQSPTQ